MNKLDEVKKLIDKVFSDISVPPETTLGRMIAIREHAQEGISALEDDGIEADESEVS